MRVSAISSRELIEVGFRLTGGFCLTEDEQAIRTLRNWRGPTSLLKELCPAEGIWSGPIFRKIPASGPEYGVPYVSARDIVKTEIRPNGYLSYKHGQLLEQLLLREKTILLTCSGMNLGESVWVRSDMGGLAGSGDLIRLQPDSARVAPGFVFAFLKSRYGHVSIRKLIYGGHIKHVAPSDVGKVVVPRLPSEVEQEADGLVEHAARLRVEATKILGGVKSDLERELSMPESPARTPAWFGHAVSSYDISEDLRLEAFFHNPAALQVDRWAKSHRRGYSFLGEVAEVFDVPPFKHIYVDPGHGVPFFTSGDLFRLDRVPEKYLSWTRTRDLKKYILTRGWVLLARSGQLGGILGRPQFSDSALDGASTSDHVIRIASKDASVPAGYLYAYLATESVGYVLLTRTMTGASIPALWPTYLERIPVVKADRLFMENIHERVVEGFEKRVAAGEAETTARNVVERAIERLV
jgi:type I restriction enzyme S subunit